jgi:hypothetical protein
MAAEANLSLLRQHAAVILARQAARRIIVRKIRAEGRIKLGSLSHAVLSRLAIELVEQCPGLVAEALADPIVVQMSQVSNRKRRPAAQGLPLCKTQERNGGPQR